MYSKLLVAFWTAEPYKTESYKGHIKQSESYSVHRSIPQRVILNSQHSSWDKVETGVSFPRFSS